MPPPAFCVLGTPVHAVTTEEVLAFARERVAAGRPAQIATVNAEFVMRARRDPAFARTLARADVATPDSFLVVWALRRAGARVEDRVGGSDLIWQLSEQAVRHGHRVFLLGGAHGVAAAAADRLRERYPGLAVAGAHAGSPAPERAAFIVDLIRRSRADILFVAYGAPQQEIWIANNLRETGAAIGMGVGGSFDYVAGRVRRAPMWMRRNGLEWLWRLVRQPWRWRRMLALPAFIWLVWRGGPAPEAGERV